MTQQSLEQAAAHARELLDLMVRLDTDSAIAADLEGRLAALVADLRPHAKEPEAMIPTGINRPRGYLDRSPVTGRLNPMAPPVVMSIQGQSVTSTVTLGLAYQGPPGRVHGGWVATLLDHLMGCASGSVATTWVFTRSLTVEYDHAVPLYEELEVEAHVAEVDGRKIWIEGSISAGGQVCARARGLWLGPREAPTVSDAEREAALAVLATG